MRRQGMGYNISQKISAKIENAGEKKKEMGKV